MSDEADEVGLAAQLERVSGLLESTILAMISGGMVDLIPDNAYDWWETLKQQRELTARQMREQRARLIAKAKEKLTPDEWEALRNGD